MGQTPSVGRTLFRLAITFLVLQFVGCLTLQNARPLSEPAPFLCLAGCGQEELRDAVSNIILFIPLGWVLRYWVSPRVALILCGVATVGIETIQSFALIGRDSSLRDILTNIAGGWIGIWLYQSWSLVIRADRELSRRIALGLGTAWVLVLLATAFAFHLSGSRNPWWGMWANHLEAYAPFDGTLDSVRLNQWTPPAAQFSQDNPLREALAKNELTTEVVAINGASVSRPTALIFAVTDEFDNEMLFVGGANRSIQFQARTRLNSWGFGGLSIRLPIDSSIPGDTLRIRARVQDDRWELSLRSRSQAGDITIPITVGMGWISLLPLKISIAYEWYVMNVLWLATLAAPVAYYLYRWKRRQVLGVALPILYAPPLVVPLLTGIGWPRASDWIGVSFGLIFGVLFAWRSLSRHPRP